MRKRKTHSTIITLLVVANVFVVTLFFNAYLDTKQVALRDSLAQMGNVVGMSAGVQPNQWNLMAQELSDWEKELAEREQAVAEKETLLAESTNSANERSLIYITVIGLLLLVLIIMNFVLDWRRSEERQRRGM